MLAPESTIALAWDVNWVAYTRLLFCSLFCTVALAATSSLRFDERIGLEPIAMVLVYVLTYHRVTAIW